MNDETDILPEKLPGAVTALIRQVMNTAGTVLAGYGLITGGTVELAVGAVMACIPYVWAFTRARLSKRIVQEAVAQKNAAVEIAQEEIGKSTGHADDVVKRKIAEKLNGKTLYR